MRRGPAIVLGAVLFAVFMGVITWQMVVSQRKHRVEVCMAFQGRTNCATASGASREEAYRTAADAACSVIASGMSDTQSCGRREPVSTRWLK